MSGPRFVHFLSVALVAAGLGVSASARAQDSQSAPCRLCSADPSEAPNARPAAPLRLQVETRLDFDNIVVNGNGNAVLALSPGGVARMSGVAIAGGGRAMPGSVQVRGEPGRAVRVEFPRQIQLFGAGTSSIRIDSLTTDLPPFPRIGDDGTLSFRFGGDLRLTGDSDGAYRGSVDIVVDYL